jgi:hypothetical protein
LDHSRDISSWNLTCALRVLVLLFFVPLLSLAADQNSSSLKESPDPSYAVNGYVSTRYIYRTAKTPEQRVTDQDAFGDLRFDVSSPKERSAEFHFSGTARSDLDGGQGPSTFHPFEDAADTHRSRTSGYLYEAHLDLNDPLAKVTQVRLGRQAGTRDEPVFFDGIAVDAGGEKLNLTLYGGAAVHFYEIDNRWGGDVLEGAGLDVYPTALTGLSVDYLAVRDERTFTAGDGIRHDRLFAMKLTQRFAEYNRFTAKYRYLNSEPRDVSANASVVSSAVEAEMSLGYFRQFRTQNELSNEFSLFFDVIGQSAPYQSYDLKIRKFFKGFVAIDLGYFRRELLDAAVDQGPFDREFTRKYVDGEIADFIVPGLAWTLVAEWWESGQRTFRTLGSDLSYAVKRKSGKQAKVSIGTSYSLFKYDYYIDLGAREQVRTYYFTSKYPLGAQVFLNAGYEFEHGIENYQTVKAGMRYDY